MSNRYNKQHYEDVARILVAHVGYLPRDLLTDFADLFAADNPPMCRTHGIIGHEQKDDCPLEDGFDREQFLAACGLEPTCPLCSSPSENGDVHPSCADTEQAYSDYVAGKIGGEFE